jgi:hypothetical protein
LTEGTWEKQVSINKRKDKRRIIFFIKANILMHAGLPALPTSPTFFKTTANLKRYFNAPRELSSCKFFLHPWEQE